MNSIIDACYRAAESKAWEPVDLDWRGGTTAPIAPGRRTHEGLDVIKEEVLPDGRRKIILKDPDTGELSDRII